MSAVSVVRDHDGLEIFVPLIVHAIIALMRVWYRILPVGICLWLVACGANTPPPSLAAQTPLVSTPFATDIASESRTPAPSPTSAVTPDALQPIELTLWVPEEFAPGAERGGDVLARQLVEFEAAHPNIRINYVLKAPYGKGGIVDWLTQLNELMPDQLPDAAIVDSRDLDELAKLGLLHPLQRDLPAGTFWDLFPPAQRIARQRGQWNNQPLVLETEHLVYDTRRLTKPPVSWQEVLSGTLQFAFAADSTEAFLFHYLQNGESVDPRDPSALGSGVMQAILDYYQRARAGGNLKENAAVMKSAREVMPLFVSGQTPMAQVRARDFLIERENLPNAMAAAIPTRDGSEAALVSGWTYVVITDDPPKQRAAGEYLAWMIDPGRMAAWSSAARLLPASTSAFAQSQEVSDYADLVWSLLEHAIVAPGFSQQAPYADAWHKAVTAVMNGQLAPDDAAVRAVQAITQ